MSAVYSLAEASRISGLSSAEIEAFARAGLLAAAAGDDLRLTFQDLSMLRAARALRSAKLSAERVLEMFAEARARLPRSRPLSGVRISRSGRALLTFDDRGIFDVVSGQTSFDFAATETSAADSGETVVPLVDRAGLSLQIPPERSAEDWFEVGLELEASSADHARDAYRRALELDPTHAEARLHLGCLLRDAGLLRSAIAHFEDLLSGDRGNAEAAYALAEALEAAGDDDGACLAYRAAIELDPESGEALVRLALLEARAGPKASASADESASEEDPTSRERRALAREGSSTSAE